MHHLKRSLTDEYVKSTQNYFGLETQIVFQNYIFLKKNWNFTLFLLFFNIYIKYGKTVFEQFNKTKPNVSFFFGVSCKNQSDHSVYIHKSARHVNV